jgi:hypothetical protein
LPEQVDSVTYRLRAGGDGRQNEEDNYHRLKDVTFIAATGVAPDRSGERGRL